mgnify:CR=1 FL=1
MNQRLLKNGENINSQDITLFCFPFAGGGASTYTSWIKKLKDKITVCPIQLPGREERIMEKPYTDMSELLRDLTDEIVIAIKGKYVLWGHSMGGKIAYELEKYLENKGYQAQCIFASGCRIPNIPEPNPIYHLKDEAFKRELERFGGTPKKVLENKELLDFFLPMLRADFTLADTYCDNSMTVLHSPIVAFGGRQAMKHTSYSGVEVIRDLLKKDTGNKLIAPVVFSCNYDEVMVPVLFEKKLGKLDYISTQTPQVLIDFQILKMTEGILFSWDVVDEAFCEGTIDTMFDCYMKALEDLIEQPDSWNKKIEFMELSSFPERYENIATLGKTNGYIHDKVFENMEKKSNNIAVLETDTHKSITYQELKIKVENLMCILIEFGVHKGDKVGIYLPKGSNQIVAVLAILGIGACYVPIGVNQALQRMRGMLLKANIKTIISDENGKKYLQENVQQNIVLVNAKNAVKSSCDTMPDSTERSAYIIFTSGTTGEPKGVEISHRSAWNTINEVNKICCVDEHSKILSVSALEFDLSVYDIFGILSEGGTVVVTSENARRDAAVWANAIMDYNITVWNSVPYLLNMLLTVAETEGKVFPSLKKVILSGDWIGLDLPERLKRIAPNAEMLAMGGATEAAIWSNFIQVQLPLPSKWVSIPYGKPLAGQLYRVVDQAGKDCPNWVSGELWIGGDGVAKGYISDDLLTEEKFVYENGIRWYKTGDMGRFWPDGTIEFLGRKDTQVKIRGHRIEMGEIESILNQ